MGRMGCDIWEEWSVSERKKHLLVRFDPRLTLALAALRLPAHPRELRLKLVACRRSLLPLDLQPLLLACGHIELVS